MNPDNKRAMEAAIRQKHILENCLKYSSTLFQFSETSKESARNCKGLKLREIKQLNSAYDRLSFFYLSENVKNNSFNCAFLDTEFNSGIALKKTLMLIPLQHWLTVSELCIHITFSTFNLADPHPKHTEYLEFLASILMLYLRRAVNIKTINFRYKSFYPIERIFKIILAALKSDSLQKIAICTTPSKMLRIIAQKARYFNSIVCRNCPKVTSFFLQCTVNEINLIKIHMLVEYLTKKNCGIFKLNVSFGRLTPLRSYNSYYGATKLLPVVQNVVPIINEIKDVEIITKEQIASIIFLYSKELIEFLSKVERRSMYSLIKHITFSLDGFLSEYKILELIAIFKKMPNLIEFGIDCHNTHPTRELCMMAGQLLCGLPNTIKKLKVMRFSFDINGMIKKFAKLYPNLNCLNLRPSLETTFSLDFNNFKDLTKLSVLIVPCIQQYNNEFPESLKFLHITCYTKIANELKYVTYQQNKTSIYQLNLEKLFTNSRCKCHVQRKGIKNLSVDIFGKEYTTYYHCTDILLMPKIVEDLPSGI
uniref:F-box domain-containing protein n=1 Tax=Rhabditophanes sp. KR3021 TaxID=114890 RepID=A0AC35UDC1_9BILA